MSDFHPLATLRRRGILNMMALSLLLLLLFLTPPPPFPPPAPQHEAAFALLAENVTEYQKERAISLAVYSTTRKALRSSGLRSGQKRFAEKEEALQSRLAEYVPEVRSEIDRKAFYCASAPIARSLSVEEIREARRFFSTPEGKAFWRSTDPGAES